MKDEPDSWSAQNLAIFLKVEENVTVSIGQYFKSSVHRSQSGGRGRERRMRRKIVIAKETEKIRGLLNFFCWGDVHL